MGRLTAKTTNPHSKPQAGTLEEKAEPPGVPPPAKAAGGWSWASGVPSAHPGRMPCRLCEHRTQPASPGVRGPRGPHWGWEGPSSRGFGVPVSSLVASGPRVLTRQSAAHTPGCRAGTVQNQARWPDGSSRRTGPARPGERGSPGPWPPTRAPRPGAGAGRPPALTELAGSLDVDVVVAAAYPHDHSQGLELLQVLPGQRDGVVHHGAHRFVQHLRGASRARVGGPQHPEPADGSGGRVAS